MVGIAVGILVGTYAGDFEATKWLLSVVVFGKSILKDIIQFFLPMIMGRKPYFSSVSAAASTTISAISFGAA